MTGSARNCLRHLLTLTLDGDAAITRIRVSFFACPFACSVVTAFCVCIFKPEIFNFAAADRSARAYQSAHRRAPDGRAASLPANWLIRDVARSFQPRINSPSSVSHMDSTANCASPSASQLPLFVTDLVFIAVGPKPILRKY